MCPPLCSPGMLAEQFAADGPRLQLYDFAEKHWEHLMNWQHATMYLFFGLAGMVSLIIHTTEAAPLALDRLMLAIAFFNEGKKKDICVFRSSLWLFIIFFYNILQYVSYSHIFYTTSAVSVQNVPVRNGPIAYFPLATSSGTAHPNNFTRDTAILECSTIHPPSMKLIRWMGFEIIKGQTDKQRLHPF